MRLCIKPRIPNIISIARALLPIPIIVVWPEPLLVIIALVILGGFLDWLDGYLARKWRITSILGSFLDTGSDKIFYLTVLWLLREQMPVWIFPVAALIEIVLFTIRIFSYIGILAVEVPANIFGKIKFWIQCGVLVGMLSGMFFENHMLLWCSIGLSIFALYLARWSLLMHIAHIKASSRIRLQTKTA